VREVFYSLKQHVDDFQFFLMDYIEDAGHSHRATDARNWLDEQLQANPGAEMAAKIKAIEFKDTMVNRWMDHTEALAKQSRRAYSVLVADFSQLHMLFPDHKLQGFDQALLALIELLGPMMHDEKGDTPKVEELTKIPIVEMAKAVHKEIDLLWKQVAVPHEMDFA
jgi:hypothetical protein